MAYLYQKNGKWRIQYRDAAGKIRDVKGFTNKKSTEIEAARFEENVLKERRGLLDPKADKIIAEAAKPLGEHLKDWERHVLSLGNKPGYVALMQARAKRVFDLGNKGKGYSRITELDVAEVQSIVKQLMDEGLAQQTANHLIQTVKQFSKWLYDHDRSREHVLRRLKKYTVTHQKHPRGAIPWADVAKMIAHVEAQTKLRRGQSNLAMRGPDRAMMYRVALATAFRRNAIRSLTPESFDLTEGAATVTVLPGYQKNKKALTVPLPEELAKMLRPYLAQKMKGQIVWPVPRHAAAMIARDFERAGVKFPSDNLFRDFHALRHTAITSWIATGADIKTVQELAGHSTITLTARYTHSNQDVKRAAADKMPVVMKADPTPQKNE